MGRLVQIYEFYEIKDNERHILSSIPIKRPSYQHSFGLTRNYLSGGLPTDREFSMLDAALLPFESQLSASLKS